MQAVVEKEVLGRRMWRLGAVVQIIGAFVPVLVAGPLEAVSFLGGGLSLVLGGAVAARLAFRAVAPSGVAAMSSVFVAMVLKWIVVAALLTLSMVFPGASVGWAFAGLVFAQVVAVLAVVTFRRQ